VTRVLVLGVAFLLTLGGIVGAAAAGGALLESDNGDPPEIETQQYQPDDLVSDGAPGTAEITASADADPQTVVIDAGTDPQRGPAPPIPGLGALFGPDTTERDVLPIANALIENGHEVRVYTPPEDQRRSARSGQESGPSPLGEELADADALITFRTDYDDDALEDIETFVENDGRVVMATDPGNQFDRATALGLKSTLGVSTEPGYVYNMEDNDLNYQRVYAQPRTEGALTEGVDRIVVSTATPVAAAQTDAAVVPTADSELSTTRAETDAPVLVRNENVVLIGDTELLAPENTQRADNDVLVGNLADFLVTNDRDPETQPPQTGSETGPTDPRQPGPSPTPSGETAG